ncbi:MAG: SPFH domain-containing protein [Actinomycetaceae bacterium]|nr:SPFH domain-containing protein [Actinomycetaceae bacterium]
MNADTTNPTSEQTQTSEPAGKPVGHQGVRVEIEERPAFHISGGSAYLALLVIAAMLAASIWLTVDAVIKLDQAENTGAGSPTITILQLALATTLSLALLLVALTSVTIIAPGQTSVRKFFGRYIGTIRTPGLSLATPLSTGQRTSVRVRNFETNTIKVNDLDGNPIHIAAIVVWQVSDTAKANFAVDNYTEFVSTQAESALRHVASTHAYDGSETSNTLLGATDLVSSEIAHEVAQRVAIAGVEIVEARISALAYAPEIAQAMLQRQQASAIVAAREQIVEGAVTMVNDALLRLENEQIVELDDERRAQMVSNLLVVLCSESRATPVVNAGSLYG